MTAATSTEPTHALCHRYFQLPHLRRFTTAIDRGVQALYVVVVSVFLAGFWLLFSSRPPTRSELAGTFLVAGIMLSGTLLLARAYEATEQAIDDVAALVPSDSRRQFSTSVKQFFGQRAQDRVALPFAIICFALTLSLRPRLSVVPTILFFGEAVFAWILNGYGLALALGVIQWIDSLSRYQNLELFPIPANTAGLRAASRLSGLLALQFALQTAFEITVFFLMDWRSTTAVTLVIYSVMVPLGFIALAFFLHPQFVLARIVTKAKHKRLAELERRLRAMDFVAGSASPREFALISRLVDFHRRVTASASTPLDALTAIRFVPSVLVAIAPLAKDAMEMRTIVRNVLNWF